MSVSERFQRLPTAAKLLLILTAVLLPIGIALALLGENGIREANDALNDRKVVQSRAAAGGIESLIARNALALRIASAAALQDPAQRGPELCQKTANSLATAPAISRRFALSSPNGELICAYGGFVPKDPTPLVAPGDIRAWIDSTNREVDIRVSKISRLLNASARIVQEHQERARAPAPPGGRLRRGPSRGAGLWRQGGRRCVGHGGRPSVRETRG